MGFKTTLAPVTGDKVTAFERTGKNFAGLELSFDFGALCGNYNGTSPHYATCKKVTFVNDTLAAWSATLVTGRSAMGCMSHTAFAQGYVFAGQISSSYVNTAERVNYVTPKFSAVSSANLATSAKRGCASVNSGSLGYTIAGGASVGTYYVTADQTQFVNDTTRTWSSANVATGRYYLVPVGDGSTYGWVCGGNNGAGSVIVDKITLSTGTRAANASNMITAGSGWNGGGALNSDIKGWVCGRNSTSTERITFSTDTFAAVSSANLQSAREGVGCLSNGTTAGYAISGISSSVADKINFSTEVAANQASAATSNWFYSGNLNGNMW